MWGVVQHSYQVRPKAQKIVEIWCAPEDGINYGSKKFVVQTRIDFVHRKSE